MSEDDVAIKVENLTKIYKLYSTPMDRLKEALSPIRRKYHHDFHALHDVSFEVKKGEMVGIVGKNGSGKSTLLKLITGVLTPSSGSVTVNGRISALLELGAGFNQELTGIENAYFVGTLMGYSREEMDAKLDEILSFADIGEFVHQPVKTYSSGMFVRLAFAVNINVDPEILIIDEALSVGDAYFIQKCMRKIDELTEAGTTIVFVSHDQQIVKKYCNRAILINSGAIVKTGNSKDVFDIYNAIIFDNKVLLQEPIPTDNENKIGRRYGNNEANIQTLNLLNKDGVNTLHLNTLEKCSIVIGIKTNEDLDNVIVGFTIRNLKGIDVYIINTDWKGANIINATKSTEYTVIFKQIMSLAPGKYSIVPAIARNSDKGVIRLDWIADSLIFEVVSSEKLSGICNLNSTIEITCNYSY